MFAEDEARLLAAAARAPEELESLVRRRGAGEPLEPLLGWAEFCGLRIAVEPGVFVPRRRTELLVREAVRLSKPDAVLVDMCCGSGAIGLAVVTASGGGELHAVDLEPVAVRCAQRNLAPVGGRVYAGDLFAPLPVALRGRVGMLLVNAPYVPTGELGLMPSEARLHEPGVALDGGPDGLKLHRRVAAGAAGWLAPGGHLLVETSGRQAAGTAAAVEAGGLVARTVRSEDLDATVVVGTRRPGVDDAGRRPDARAGQTPA